MVTCKVTIYGLGTHAGLGEEWADNDNAGTAAEAQAFKRACSCFGLGRYLYDLEGQWVDLDEKKRPLETPRLPDWARPKLQRRGSENGANGKHQDVPRVPWRSRFRVLLAVDGHGHKLLALAQRRICVF